MANWYISVLGAGNYSGSSVENAFNGGNGDMSGFFQNLSLGDIAYIECGEYDQNVQFHTVHGTVQNRMSIIGVKSLTTLESANGDDRPHFNQSDNNRFYIGNYWDIKNLRFTQTNNSDGYVIRPASQDIIENIKVVTSNTAVAILGNGGNSRLINCEAVATIGRAFSLRAYDYILNCYAHDSVTGFYSVQANPFFEGCIASKCTDGFILTTSINYIKNCVSYKCNNGVYINTGVGINTVYNSILSDCQKGIVSVDSNMFNFVKNNCYFNNSIANVENVQIGDSAILLNPKFKNAESGNFLVRKSSPCKSVGIGMELGVS